MDLFQEFLWDLGEMTNLPLHIDQSHACTLLLDDHLEVQLQMDANEENLIVCAFLGEIPPGRFREEVLKSAMKVNNCAYPFGFFAFYAQKNQLILHKFIPSQLLSVERCLKELENLIEEADSWRISLENGESSPLKYRSVENKPPPFMK